MGTRTTEPTAHLLVPSTPSHFLLMTDRLHTFVTDYVLVCRKHAFSPATDPVVIAGDWII